MGTPVLMKNVSVQMPADLAEQLEEYAKSHERTFSAEVRLAVKAYLAEREDKAAA